MRIIRKLKSLVSASENNAVLIGLDDWKAIKETLLLEQIGTLGVVRKREKDDSGFTNVNEIDWDNL